MPVRIEREPKPKAAPASWLTPRLPDGSRISLPRSILSDAMPFFDVLRSRRSRIGGPLEIDQLSSVLWHSMLLRTRRPSGRFDIPWESRAAPAAGGLHALLLLVLPVDSGAGGRYDPDEHSLIACNEAAIRLSKTSIRHILGSENGTTLQLAADANKYDACYENADSLMWRDAGALLTTISLVTTALELEATIVGRTGDAVVRASGLPGQFLGVGAIHIGSRLGETLSAR